MSSFVGMRSATSELDLSRSFNGDTSQRVKREKSGSSLRNISMFSKHDKPIDDECRRYSEYDSCESDDDDSDDEESADGSEYNSIVTGHSDTKSQVSRASNASNNSSSLGSRGSFADDSVIGFRDGDDPSLPADWTSHDTRAVLKISVTEQKLTKCLRLDVAESVWTAKQRIIQSLAKKLSDPLNYGLYCKKLGRFLLDHKPMSEYVEAGSVAAFELRYKRRVFHQVMRTAKESRQLLKMQSNSKRKELMNHVRQKNTEKIHAMIRKGVDPNFHGPSSGETPLTLASTGASEPKNDSHLHDRSCAPIIMALVGGGAHLDFRNKAGLTPVHVASRTSNLAALKTLLDLGASPDAVDARDLTPIYHCGSVGSHAECTSVLLQNGARLTCVDSQGWTVLHQVCRYGYHGQLVLLLDAVEQSLDAKDLINSRNATGNTPIHVCALYDQEQCLATLLRHGADPTLANYANQDVCQVAVVAGSATIINLLKNESGEKSTAKLVNDALAFPLQEPLFSDARSESISSSLDSTSASKSETTNSGVLTVDGGLPAVRTGPNDLVKGAGRPVALTMVANISDDRCQPVEEAPSDVGSVAEIELDHFDLLFIACKDYVAQNSREIDLTIGDLVAVSSDRGSDEIEGYCTGSVGDKVGLFPLRCVQAVKLRKTRSGRPATITHPPQAQAAKHEGSGDQTSLNTESDAMRNFNRNTVAHMPRESTALLPTSQPDIFHKYISVLVSKGADGYGFVLRGAKAEAPIGAFEPTPRYPALQYLESVEEGSNAYKAGLRAGQYISKINDKDVTCIGHRQIVDAIRKAGDPLKMCVIHVVTKHANHALKDTSSVGDDAASNASTSTGSSGDAGSNVMSPSHGQAPKVGGHCRSGSIGSAIGKLDSVLAMEDSVSDFSDADDSKLTATLRRRPVSRRIIAQEYQEVFSQENATSIAHSGPRQTQSLSAATARRLTRVLPPKLPDTENDGGAIPEGAAMQNGTDRPMHRPTSFHPTHVTSYSDVTPVQSRMPGAQLNRMTSVPSHPATSRKPPPAPPQRRNSRLSTVLPNSTNVTGTSFARTPSPLPATQPPVSMATANTLSTGNTPAIKQQLRPNVSGLAAAVAAAAQSRQQRASSTSSEHAAPPAVDPPKPPSAVASKPPAAPVTAKPPTAPKVPFVAPKPGRGRTENALPAKAGADGETSGALALALAAKQASILSSNASAPQAVVTPNLVKPSAVAKALRAKNSDDQRSSEEGETGRMSLPPPPPTPPNGMADPSSFVLPPPPEAYAQVEHDGAKGMLSDDLLLLPPPPEAVMNPSTPPTLPPPPDFAENKQTDASDFPPFSSSKPKNSGPPCVTSSVTSDSSADSGVDEVGSRHSQLLDSKTNIETMSVVSSLSNMSSEEGSDIGVSMTYDAKPPSSEPATGSNVYLDVLRKNKAGPTANHAPREHDGSNLVLTKVQFGAPPKIASKPQKAPPPASKSCKPAPPTPAASNAGDDATSFIATKPVTSWSVAEVGEWLRRLGLEQHVATFVENEIDGSHLPDLGKEELHELGVTRIGHRLSIEKSLKKLVK